VTDLLIGLLVPPYALALIVGFAWAIKKVFDS
jgi:hypothetical protein